MKSLISPPSVWVEVLWVLLADCNGSYVALH